MTQWLVRRGLLATVPVASLVLAFGACSSEHGDPSVPPAEEADVAAQTSEAQQIVTTLVARERIGKLTNRFMRAPVARPEPLPVPAGAKAPLAQAEPQATRVIDVGVAERFLKLPGGKIRAEVSAKMKTDAMRPATVDVPTTADGFVRIQPDNSPIGIEFAPKRVKPGVAVETADGLATYPGAAPGGGDVALRVTADAVEDFVVLEARPEQALVDYAVNVSDIAGMRLYQNVLEFLDSGGDPQIRVRPPVVIDALGVTHKARIELPDCKADSDPQTPWDRPVTAPGRSECTVRVSWDDTKVVYPAIVDPVWTTAGSLAIARYRNAAARLNSNGFAITCGGVDGNGDIQLSCEVFNPGAAGGAGSWATGPAMKKARSQFTMLSIGNDVLAVGDATYQTGNPGFRSELLSAGVWTETATNFEGGAFSPPRLDPVLTTDNNWVVMIDDSGTPFRYSVAAKAWSMGTSNATQRYNHVALAIPGSGAVMRCGGYYNSTAYKTCERYTPATNTWIMPGAVGAVADMNAARGNPGRAVVDANRVMLYGGYNNPSNVWIATSEIYNGASNTWTNVAGTIPNNFQEYTLHNTSATHIGTGRLLSTATYYPTVFDPVNSTWTQLSTCFGTCFYTMTGEGAVVSAGSKVLIVPVSSNGSYNAQTAARLFDVAEKGATCNATAECQTGLICAQDYYDGVSVCCDTECGTTNRCMACRATNKTTATGDGTCGPRKTQQYIGYEYCPSSSSSTCGNTGGYCDGAGACEKWSDQYICGYGSCADGNTQNDERRCTGQGACEDAATTNCNTGYKCMFDNACASTCSSDEYCDTGYYCNQWDSPYNLCAAKKSNGQTCQADTQCTSGSCRDGYCCDDTCDGLCEACANSLTGQANGSCKPITVAAGYQGNDCYDEGASSCGQTGYCNGAGACQLYANGTQCADIGACASETARYVPDTCNGTGTCADRGTQNCASGYSCQSGVCNTQCTSDANCASNYWCDTVNKVCVADRAQGASCARDAVCSGNANCIDGVCCDSNCAGTCRSCLKARTGLANDGTCGPILDDTDPENECAIGAGYPASCQAPGLCNGAGACRAYAKTGVECDTDVCTDSTLTTYECNGAGTCKPKATQCYPFKCDTTNNVCRVACSLDAHCVDGSSCENGTCVGQLENGSACSRGPQCKTGFCANIGEGVLQGEETGAGGEGAGGAAGDPGVDSPGVCCDEACQGTCSGCKASIKGFGSDGICEFVKNNTDPANDCEPAADDKCGLDGQCNGGGACRLAPSGTACGETSCQGNSVLGQSCNGQGDCINNQGGVDCAPYVCRDVLGAFQCTQPCADDNDCQDGYFCEEATCKKKLTNGKVCTTSGVCDSGFCVDGLCCDASCNGQCEACDAPGNEGVCTPVQGEPHGSRPKCDFAGEECGGSCDGVNAAACKYAPNGTSCGESTCTSGIAESSACDGQGSCRAADSERCAPYNCGDDDKCLDRCELDDDCSQGYQCDEGAQQCVPAAVAAECSEDRQSSVGSNGITTPCKPFLCVPASGTCAVSCAATTDCAPEFVCEASTKTCLPAPPDAGLGEEEGCACRAAGVPSRSSNHYLALIALGAALTGLRRRRQRRHLAE